MPELGPFGETRRDPSVRAMVAAFLVNKPAGGWVESVFTFATHLFFLAGFFAAGIMPLPEIFSDV
jgi:hypothetical protein